MRTDIQFAIPSLARPAKQPTLEYLARLGVPKSHVSLLLQTEEDRDAYARAGWLDYARLIYDERCHNIGEARNRILSEYPAGTHLIMLDDDIRTLVVKRGVGLRPVDDGGCFIRFCEAAFGQVTAQGTVLWGLYPIANGYYMSRTVSRGALIIGTFFGLIVRNDARFDARLRVKEDYDYSCRVIEAAGSVVRFNGVSASASHYSRGGCEHAWKSTKACTDACETILLRYPKTVRRGNRSNEVTAKHARTRPSLITDADVCL